MTDILIIIAVVLGIANLAVLFTRKPKESKDYKPDFDRLVSDITRLETSLREEIRASRAESQTALKSNREELSASLEKIRETMESRLRHIQEDNGKRLEEMRKTVDEKLQESVEKRFNESFKSISEQLNKVHQGLGEMQSLAVGVGDLKKVLSNVKTRGNLGEFQLGAILEQILSPEQYERNAHVKENSQDVVEFAVRLPGRSEYDKPVLIPIDSKFPVEDYGRLLEAYDLADGTDIVARQIDSAGKSFESAVKKCAKDIHDKYINPPVTTDFAIMFVPTEGLYAEVLRRPGLFEELQTKFKITVVGPTNTAAFLSSLQMGFRTLAIEKRSSEVWGLLGAVKAEFNKFGDVVDNAQKSLAAATNHLEKLGTRSRAIGRQLRNVEELPQGEATALIEDGEE
ncbi:MAG: DNA recombination protein RmuC [Oscillospiraceae bacterium]|jgi:DNA recombination protein RmuC|nr:DNA recombination protein RmuC [Oscillospiraceae bacterium]